jgi:hypothetical protein
MFLSAILKSHRQFPNMNSEISGPAKMHRHSLRYYMDNLQEEGHLRTHEVSIEQKLPVPVCVKWVSLHRSLCGSRFPFVKGFDQTLQCLHNRRVSLF